MNIHLVQMSHTDIGYTDSQERIREAYADFLCQALDLAGKYAHYPEHSRFHWTVETAWTLRQFVERRPERVPELVEAVRDGWIELTANYAHFTDLIDPALLEESTHWLNTFLEEHHLTVRVATHNDINGFPSALPSVLRKAGVEFLATGMNHTMALSMGPRHRMAHWTALDGTSIPVWYGDHYNLGNWMGLSARNLGELFGRPTWPYQGQRDRAEDLYPEAVESTRRFLQGLTLQNYPWNCVLIQCGGLQADNSPPDAVMCDIVRRFNEERPLGDDIQIRVSSLGNFYDDVSQGMKDNPDAVEKWQGAWPDYWAFGLGSAPNEMKAIRRAQILLPTVKALAGGEDVDVREAVEKALLALEHTFGAYDSVMQWYGANARQQWCLKQETFYRAEQLCDSILEKSELAATRKNPLQNGEVLILNPLQLTDRICSGIVQLPETYTQGEHPPTMTWNDRQVPLQRLSSYDMNYGRHCLGGHWLFRAQADGKRESRVRINSTGRTDPNTSRTDDREVLENDWVRLELDREELGLRVLRNRKSGRDYLAPSITPLGALMHEKHPQIQRPPGPTEHDNESKGVVPTISSLSPNAGVHRVLAKRSGEAVLTRGPLFDQLSASGTLESYESLRLTVRLHHATGCIELIYSGVKQWLNNSNADHVLFGADLKPPRFLLETSGGLFEPEQEQVPGSCLDFFTVQHCAAIHDATDTLVVDPVDTPLMQIGQPTLGAWLRTLQSPRPALVSNVYNNLWFTNFPTVHSGPLSARYILKIGALTDLDAHRQDLQDCAHPPLIGYAGEKRLPFPPERFWAG